jgi:hypothetical protein
VLRRAESWLGDQRAVWERRLDRLGAELSGPGGQRRRPTVDDPEEKERT